MATRSKVLVVRPPPTACTSHSRTATVRGIERYRLDFSSVDLDSQ